MAYIGNPPADRYSKLEKQDLTGDGTVGPYTLDYAVGGVAEIEVFVNNVRQEPTTAYTVAGDQLTMTGTVASTDDFYVVFQGKAIASGQVPEKQRDGSYVYLGNVDINGNDLILDADGDSKIEASTDDTINIISGGTTGLTVDSSGRVLQPEKPYVAVDMGGGAYLSIAAGAAIPFDNAYDGDTSLWDTSAYEFTCPVAGLYLMTFSGIINTAAVMQIDVQKNNTTINKFLMSSERGIHASYVVKCVANDTLRWINALGTAQSYYQATGTSRYTAGTITLLG